MRSQGLFPGVKMEEKRGSIFIQVKTYNWYPDVNHRSPEIMVVPIKKFISSCSFLNIIPWVPVLVKIILGRYIAHDGNAVK